MKYRFRTRSYFRQSPPVRIATTRGSVPASAKEQVLKALGEASTRIREKLGKSLPSVQKFDAPVENVTTSSLEALRAYSLGIHSLRVRNNSAAIPLFQRAISLDPNFAMAYARLGASYSNLRETVKMAENTRKAYTHRVVVLLTLAEGNADPLAGMPNPN